MGILNLFGKQKAEEPKPASDLAMHSDEATFREHYKGHLIEQQASKLSDDFTVDEELLNHYKKLEARYPVVLNVSNVRMWGLSGNISGSFNPENKLASWHWMVFAEQMEMQKGKLVSIDQNIPFKLVSDIVKEMDGKYGQGEKEVDDGSYSWEWRSDGIKYSLSSTVSDEISQKADDLAFAKVVIEDMV